MVTERRVNPERESFGNALLALATSLSFDLDCAVIAVYWHALKDVAPDVRSETMLRASGKSWFKFPQPAHLKDLAAGVIAERKQRAFKAMLSEDCTVCQGTRWDTRTIDGVERLQRCSCWTTAKKAADAVGGGEARLLPPVNYREDEL